ncbi:hypothetical protein GCM10023321_25760 [Pseudonocardia eucalypti]|uniref:Insertion element IS402-like domain-containing protein n=1 Tax=Pseudonocardia eucalypti TaxID=648755 RepID=A0ABP9Q1B5_9PSEU
MGTWGLRHATNVIVVDDCPGGAPVQTATRKKARCVRSRKAHAHYPTDLSDAQWTLIESVLPAPSTGGRREKHARREILNAILYVERTGCSWRLLPDSFPPWPTVYWHWARWRDRGSLAIVQSMLCAET